LRLWNLFELQNRSVRKGISTSLRQEIWKR